ncbi:MAG: hypothetical protein AAF602_10215 [Myxococcota bacterium]
MPWWVVWMACASRVSGEAPEVVEAEASEAPPPHVPAARPEVERAIALADAMSGMEWRWSGRNTSGWPWHTGIYLGDGQVLNSHPSHGVVTMRLDDISWDALFATRP